MFGDEIAIRAQTLVHDAANPAEVMRRRDGLRDRRAQPGGARRDRPHDPGDRPRVGGLQLHVRAARWPTCSCSGSTSAPACATRCACTFERWNGNGYPGPCSRARRSRSPMRVVHLSHDMEAIGRLFSPEHALDAARDRRDRTYDPALADLFVAHGRAWFERLREIEPWDAVLALEPEPHRMLDGEELDDALTVAADFIDLKSPYMGGHSRRCAELAADAARVLGLSEEDVTDAPPGGARARLRHHRGAELDLGQARPAHAHGVRSGRASPDADRADAAPLAGAGRAEPGRVRAPREVRRVRLPQARAGRRRRSRRRACWPRRRSTWG